MHNLPNSINLNQLQEKMKTTDQLTLVLFVAEWSGACSMMQPVYESIKQQLSPTVDCLWLNIDKYSTLAADLRIQKVPTILLFKNGELVQLSSGMMPRLQLLRLIGTWLHLPAAHPWMSALNTSVGDA